MGLELLESMGTDGTGGTEGGVIGDRGEWTVHRGTGGVRGSNSFLGSISAKSSLPTHHLK